MFTHAFEQIGSRYLLRIRHLIGKSLPILVISVVFLKSEQVRKKLFQEIMYHEESQKFLNPVIYFH